MHTLRILTAIAFTAFSSSSFAQNSQRYSSESCAVHCANFCQTSQDRQFCMGYCPSECEKKRAGNLSPEEATGSIKKPPTTNGTK